MFTSFIKLTIRNIRRQPFFSFINISGLAVGLAACWLIGVFIFHERSYDEYLPKADRICAVAIDLKFGDEEGRTTNTPPPVAGHLVTDFPEMEMTARTFNLGEVVVHREEPGQTPISFNENRVMAVDTSFLALFEFPMIDGDLSALNQPGNIVLTEKMAKKYFDTNEVIGQTLKVNDRDFKVSGLVENLSSTSTIQFDLLLPMADFKIVERFSWSWIWLQVDTWARLREVPTAESLAALEAKFPDMVNTYAPATFKILGQDFEEQKKQGGRYEIKLLPLTSLHLGAVGVSSRLTTLGDGEQVRIFGIVALLILILAAVNYMNLTTARSMKRAQEVGVRKTLGSRQSLLMGQFLVEAVFYGLIALVGAAVLAAAALPVFNLLTSLEMAYADLFSNNMLVLAVLLSICTGLLGGLYPALYLSNFQPMDIFKSSKGSFSGGQKVIRSGLVIFQFSISVGLMLFSWMVFQQLAFAKKQSTGLQREHILIVENTRHLTENSAKETFRQQLLQMPEVLSATNSTYLPSQGSFGDFYDSEQGDQPQKVVENLPLSSFLTDEFFVPTLGIEVIAGRNFMENGSSDSASIILNETAVRTIGWENSIGKFLKYPGNANQRFQVVGIVKDFHLASVKTPIEPVAIFHQTSNSYQIGASSLALRLRPGSEKGVIEKTGKMWSTMVSAAPFEYDFLDASFARLYRSEAKMGVVLSALTGLAFFIGCLGLFGLAAFTAEQRTKEIGIRKVLGANVTGIVGLLSKDFLKLVFVALIIASPLAYYFMEKWLQEFADRVDIQWWIFALTGVVVIVMAFLTVSFQSVKAALANPADSLKTE